MCFKNEKANLSSERAMAACLNSLLLASSLKKPHPSWKKMDPSYCSLIWHQGEILARTNRYLENTWAALSKNYIDQQSFTKERATADTHELEMEWRYQLARIKGVRISVLSSYTGAKQTQTKLRAHCQNTAFTWHTQKRRWTLCFKKGSSMLRTSTAESTCTPHQLSFKEMGPRRTNLCLAISALSDLGQLIPAS